MRKSMIGAVLFAVLALFASATAEAKKGEPTEQRVYLQFWSVAPPDGETKPVAMMGLTDVIFTVKTEVTTGTSTTTLTWTEPLQYEWDGRIMKTYLSLKPGIYNIELATFPAVNSEEDPLGEVFEYRIAAALELQEFGEGIIEVAKRSEGPQLLVEARDPPMVKNVEVALEPKFSAPRADLQR